MPEACGVAAQSMRLNGWHVGLVPAVSTAPGPTLAEASPLCSSAGVFVSAPQHVGCEWLHGRDSWDASPAGCEGRLAVGWVPVLGGIAVMSAYFWHSEGWSQRNQILMGAIIDVVRSLDCMWVLAGDFIMEPDLLQAHYQYGDLAGLLVRPDRGTCKVQESWRCYDYFVVDVRLSPYVVAVQALDEEDFAPHIPVRLRLAARAKGLIKRVLLAPKALPLQPSMGCARAPAQWPQLPPELSSQQQSDEAVRVRQLQQNGDLHQQAVAPEPRRMSEAQLAATIPAEQNNC